MVGVPECRHRFASTRTIFSSLSIRSGYGLSERRNFGHLLLSHFVMHVLVEPGKGQECITRVLFAEKLRGIHEVRAIVEQS